MRKKTKNNTPNAIIVKETGPYYSDAYAENVLTGRIHERDYFHEVVPEAGPVAEIAWSPNGKHLAKVINLSSIIHLYDVVFDAQAPLSTTDLT